MTGPRGSPAAEEDGDGEGDDVGWRTYVLDLLGSAAAVALVGLLLFAVSGVWPPLVAIESPSMEPNVDTGDLVFVMEADRFPGPGHHESTGVVTAAAGERSGYERFHGPGDVIVFQPDGNAVETPIIHRAMFWVEAGENWIDEADPRYANGAGSCADVDSCPAPHAGFVTKGDNNRAYDQVTGLPSCTGECAPVRPSWVVGTAEARLPELGRIRLQTGRMAAAAGGTPSADDDPGAAREPRTGRDRERNLEATHTATVSEEPCPARP